MLRPLESRRIGPTQHLILCTVAHRSFTIWCLFWHQLARYALYPFLRSVLIALADLLLARTSPIRLGQVQPLCISSAYPVTRYDRVNVRPSFKRDGLPRARALSSGDQDSFQSSNFRVDSIEAALLACFGAFLARHFELFDTPYHPRGRCQVL